MNESLWRKPPLWKIFRDLTIGHAGALVAVKALAATARGADSSCPFGAQGVLDDLRNARLSPPEIAKLFRLCGKDPLRMNAVIVSIYTETMSPSELRGHIRSDFRAMRLGNISKTAKTYNPKFGQYCNRKSSGGAACVARAFAI